MGTVHRTQGFTTCSFARSRSLSGRCSPHQRLQSHPARCSAGNARSSPLQRPLPASRAFSSASDAVEHTSSANASANLYGAIAAPVYLAIRKPAGLRVEAHQPAAQPKKLRKPRVRNLSLSDRRDVVVPDPHGDHLAFRFERLRRAAACPALLFAATRRSGAFRSAPSSAARADSGIRRYRRPRPIRDRLCHRPQVPSARASRLGTLKPTASLDRIQPHRVDTSAHDASAYTLNRKCITSPSRTT